MKVKFKSKVMVKSRRALAFMLSKPELKPKPELKAKAVKTTRTPYSINPVRATSTLNKVQQGFTLIELLVVVSILAALAGLASVAMDGYQQDSEEKITRVEMQRIANAIRRFKADTGYWPKTEADGALDYADDTSTIDDDYEKADFGFLFKKPDVSIPKWTPEYAIGWHGPYINLDAMKTIIVDPVNDPKSGCWFLEDDVLKPLKNNVVTSHVDADPTTRVAGLVDRFEQIRKKKPGKEYCVLAPQRKDSSKTFEENREIRFKVAEFSASPYLYEAKFTHNNSLLCQKDNDDSDKSVTCIALRSFGADGVDDGGADISDDIVFVLQVNTELGE